MCDFCDNIKDVEWYKEQDTWNRNNAIVQTGEKTFGLWVECDDYFYSGVAMKVNFCPLCGLNLYREAERKERLKNDPHYQKYGFEF